MIIDSSIHICDFKKTALEIVRKKVVSLKAQTRTNEPKITVL